jgi:hypothetical protein
MSRSFPLLASLLASLRARREAWVPALTLSALVAVIAAVGCSFLVKNELPSGYTCLPGAAEAGVAVCPEHQHCVSNGAGTQFTCENECDQLTNPCEGSLTCDSRGWCVGPDASTGDGSADDAGNQADAGSSLPEAGQTTCGSLGCRCSVSADCPMGLACVDELAATPEIWNAWVDSGVGAGDGTGSGICMQPCCTSNDCTMADNYVCFATGGGGSYCVMPDWLGDRAAIGTTTGGASCDTGSGCRSGLCAGGLCADTCCSTRQQLLECASGSACRFGSFPGGTTFDTHEAARCVAAGGGGGNAGANASTCTSNGDCRSNLCLASGGFNSTSTCRDACRSLADCTAPAGGGGNGGNGGSTQATPPCTYVEPGGQAGAEIVAACSPAGNRGGVDAGPPVCFDDSDCPPLTRCRPQRVRVDGGMYSVLACGP